MTECNIGHISDSSSAFPVMAPKHRAQLFIRDLRWIPRSLLWGRKADIRVRRIGLLFVRAIRAMSGINPAPSGTSPDVNVGHRSRCKRRAAGCEPFGFATLQTQGIRGTHPRSLLEGVVILLVSRQAEVIRSTPSSPEHRCLASPSLRK